MNYKKIYDNLMNKRKTIILENQYTEKHHIIPKCFGGPDTKENLVALTPEEHFLAHQLLVKMYPEHKGLKYALFMMTIGPNGRRNNNKLFGWIKRDYNENRPKSRGSLGKKLSPERKEKLRLTRLGTHHTEVTKRKISNTKKGVKMSEDAKRSMTEKRNKNTSWIESQRNKRLSDESKAKISVANNGRVFPIQECPHCLKNGAGPNMTRYHFDNCKMKI